MFQLTFPQPEMLTPTQYARVENMQRNNDPAGLAKLQTSIRDALNPHPSEQVERNVPTLNGKRILGIQHKYPDTVLFFPAAGQTCHAYCTYCFRWAQFVKTGSVRFKESDPAPLLRYIQEHPEVTDVLITGGDPLIMATSVLASYIIPLLSKEAPHVTTIRIGTKALAYWPQRFTSDQDAASLLRLFESITSAGRHLTIMAHYSHPRELMTPTAEKAVKLVKSTGAAIRLQAPIINHVNADAGTWARLLTKTVNLGIVPYYLFVERNTGPARYFSTPLATAYDVFAAALRNCSGLARTARGPVMSASEGKVRLLGETRIGTERVFILEYVRSRLPQLTMRPFFARYDSRALWFDDLVPATPGDVEFFGGPKDREKSRAPKAPSITGNYP